MDKDILVRLIEGQAKAAGLQVNTALVENAVGLAGPYVWNSFAWQFRRKESTITLISGQEYVDLPKDFGHFLAVRYRNGTTDGWKLRYFSEDSYELFFPNPSALSNDEPRAVKIVRNEATNVWRAYFTPVPNSAYSLTLIHAVKWGDHERFKEGFEKLVMVAAWIFIHVPGTMNWRGVNAAYKDSLAEAIYEIDPAHRAVVTQIRVPARFRTSDGGGSVNDPIDPFRYDLGDY